MLGLFGFVAVLIAVGFIYLTSRAGGERILRLALASARNAIQGTLTAERLELGGNRLVLHGVTLRDPEGELVAEVETIEVRLSLLTLIRRTLDLRELTIATPRLHLRSDDRGLNLSRAIQPRHPSAPSSDQNAGTGAFGLLLEDFQLSAGAIDFEQVSDQGKREVRLDRLEAHGAGGYSTVDQKLKIDLKLEGRVTRPTQGPLSLTLTAQGVENRRAGQLALVFAGLRLDGSAQMAGDDLRAKLTRLELPPQLVAAWVPTYPLLVPLSASGEGARHAGLAASKLELKAGSTTVVLEGSLNTETLQSPGVTLRASGINLRQLIANGPESNLGLAARVQGGGHSMDTLDGSLELVLPAGQVRDNSVGPIEVKASAHRGNVELSKLVANLPGFRLAGTGRGSERDVFFSGTLTAADLTKFSKTLGGIARQPPLDLAGSGELQVAVRGPTRHPGLSINGAFEKIRYDTYSVEGLSVAGTIPDIDKPLQSQLSLTARRLAAADRTLRDVSVKLTTRGRELAADVRTMGVAQLVLHADAVVDPDHQGLLLQGLQLRYPEAQWSLQRPARIHFGGGDLSSERFELRAGKQSIAAAGSLRGKRLRANLQIQALDLSLLPKPLVSPSLRLAGFFSADVRAEGAMPKPGVKARVRLQNGRFKQYEGLELTVDGSYERDRAVGTADAHGFGTGLRADFDVPIQALRTRSHERVHLQATLGNTQIEQLLHALDRPEPITGTAAAKIELSGTANHPQLKLELQAKSLRHAQSPPADVALIAQSDENGKLGSSLQWTVAKAKSSLVLRTPLTLAAALENPPTAETLRSMLVEMELDVHELPLELLHDAALVQNEVHGKVSIRGELRGSAKAPAGKVVVSLMGGALGHAPPTDASLVLTASTTGIEASINAQRSNRRLLDLVASVQVSPGKVGGIADIVDRPLSVKATLGPISLEEVRALTATDVQKTEIPPVPPASGPLGAPEQATLDGVLRCDLSVTGSLGNPVASLRAEFDQLSAQKVALGKATLEYSYRQASSTLSLELASKGGTLRVTGQSKMDLSYDSIQKGLAFADVPIDLTVNASKFDLAGFSGLVSTVRIIGGTLDAQASIQGTIGVPKVQGKLEWSQGTLALLGYGEYQQIHLLLEGTEQQVQLRELKARSGSGQATVSAEAHRAGSSLTLTGKVSLDKFPIISDDQLVATLSLASTLEGEISTGLVNVRRLQIPQAHVELPDTKRRDLQALTLPDDIVLVRNGEPLDKERFQRAAAALAGQTTGSQKKASPGSSTRQFVATVDAPRNVWIKGNDINIEIGLSDGFRVEYAQTPLVFGEVKLLQGRADVLGRRFDVQKDSTVRFTGPPTTPTLDVTALYNNEREQVKIFVNVRGEGSNLSIKTNSDPPLTETEIFTMIATGHRTLRTNSGASTSGSSVAVSALGSLAANQLKNLLVAKLPLDVLSIEAGESGLAGTKLEAGTYVTDRIYIGYTARINARPDLGQNANEVRLDYQIAPRWYLEATYGDAKAGGADLIWNRDF